MASTVTDLITTPARGWCIKAYGRSLEVGDTSEKQSRDSGQQVWRCDIWPNLGVDSALATTQLQLLSSTLKESVRSIMMYINIGDTTNRCLRSTSMILTQEGHSIPVFLSHSRKSSASSSASSMASDATTPSSTPINAASSPPKVAPPRIFVFEDYLDVRFGKSRPVGLNSISCDDTFEWDRGRDFTWSQMCYSRMNKLASTSSYELVSRNTAFRKNCRRYLKPLV